jgi:hypothetical protein
MFGCHIHHLKRKARIEKAGCRENWISFDQWHCDRRMKKAEDQDCVLKGEETAEKPPPHLSNKKRKGDA